MAWCRVIGGPQAPSDKQLAVGSTLKIELLGDYADGLYRYPRLHQAEWDATNSRWKPLSATDGTYWTVPAGLSGDPVPPCSRLEERQIYSDGTSQVTVWDLQLEGTAGAPPIWNYAAPDVGAAALP